MCNDLMHRPLRVTLEHREYNGKTQENVKYVNASEHPDCKHVFKTPVTNDSVAKPKNEAFASAAPVATSDADDDYPF